MLWFAWFGSVTVVRNFTSACFTPFATFGFIILTRIFMPCLMAILLCFARFSNISWAEVRPQFLFVLCISFFYVIQCFFLLSFIECYFISCRCSTIGDLAFLVVPSLCRLFQDPSPSPRLLPPYRNTVLHGWLEWRQSAESKIGVQVIPANPLHIALSISVVTDISVRNNTGISSIESVLYGI